MGSSLQKQETSGHFDNWTFFVFFTPNQAQANGVEFINHGAKHYHGIPARWDPGVDFFLLMSFL
jgi:hypothetical protein